MHVDQSGKSALNDQVLDGEARYPGEPAARGAAQADGVGFIDRSRVDPKGRRVEMCVKNRNSRQPLADEMTLEEVPKKKKARRLDWRRSGPNDAMLHEQAALPMVEGGAQLCRKEECRRSA